MRYILVNGVTLFLNKVTHIEIIKKLNDRYQVVAWIVYKPKAVELSEEFKTYQEASQKLKEIMSMCETK